MMHILPVLFSHYVVHVSCSGHDLDRVRITLFWLRDTTLLMDWFAGGKSKFAKISSIIVQYLEYR